MSMLCQFTSIYANLRKFTSVYVFFTEISGKHPGKIQDFSAKISFRYCFPSNIQDLHDLYDHHDLQALEDLQDLQVNSISGLIGYQDEKDELS